MAVNQTSNDQESKVNEGAASTDEQDNSQEQSQQSQEPHTADDSQDVNDQSGDGSNDGENDSDGLPEWARKQIQKANREAASYRTQLREVQEQFKDAKTEDELNKILAPLREQLDKSEEANRRLERDLVINKYGLDDDLAEFITGDDPGEWEKQAAKLAERVTLPNAANTAPRKGPLHGRNGRELDNDVDPKSASARIIARNRY